MLFHRKNEYEKFATVFVKRYRKELKFAGPVHETEIIRLFLEFRDSGMTPEEWFEEQESS
jgi:hypothetical protein